MNSKTASKIFSKITINLNLSKKILEKISSVTIFDYVLERITFFLAKIRELSEEYRKKVELFNLLEDFYKSIINIKPTVFKMDGIVNTTPSFQFSHYSFRNLEPSNYIPKMPKSLILA